MIEIQYQFENWERWQEYAVFSGKFSDMDLAVKYLEEYHVLTFHTEFIYCGSCKLLFSQCSKIYFRFLELDINELVSIKSPWYIGL